MKDVFTFDLVPFRIKIATFVMFSTGAVSFRAAVSNEPSPWENLFTS